MPEFADFPSIDAAVRSTWATEPWRCPRCDGVIPRHKGRKPLCCRDCRTPAELRDLEVTALNNDRLRKAGLPPFAPRVMVSA